jgi:hypothetical protein
MSSKYVRNQIEDFLASNWSDTLFYVVDDHQDISTIPANNTDAWVGVEYVSSNERVNCLPANMWDERGTVFLHIVTPNGWASNHAIEYGDKLQKLMRGIRLEKLVIESVSPVISQSPPAIEKSSEWNGFVLIMSYQSIKE